VASPADPNATALPLGVDVSYSYLTIVGQQETDTLILQGQNGAWSLVSSPSLPGSADGFAGIAAIPGGGL